MASAARQFKRRQETATGERRVLLREPEGPNPGDPASTERYWRETKRAQRRRIKTRPIVRLADGEPDWGVALAPGDEIGYGMQPYFIEDCLQAAIATATQVPVEQVPDLKLIERFRRSGNVDRISRESWETIDHWAEAQGFEAMLWEAHELPVPRHRWIGIVPDVGDVGDAGPSITYTPSTLAPGAEPVNYVVIEGAFTDHCLVMSYGELVFDPAWSSKSPPGMEPLKRDPSQITYGLSFERRSNCHA